MRVTLHAVEKVGPVLLHPRVEGQGVHDRALVGGALPPQLLQLGFTVSFFIR